MKPKKIELRSVELGNSALKEELIEGPDDELDAVV